MYRYGFLDESQNKLDYVLALTPQDVLERRLQVRTASRFCGCWLVGAGRWVPGAGDEQAALLCWGSCTLCLGCFRMCGVWRLTVRSLLLVFRPPLPRPWCSSWAWPRASTTRAC